MTWRCRIPPLILLALPACQSSAPYTIPAAIINSTVAVGAALRQRAEGGCYAVCAPGTVCNPRTGYCEQATCLNCQSWEICALSDAVWRCVPAVDAAIPSIAQKRPPPTGPAGELAPGVGISPRTGAAPAPPVSKPGDGLP
jgi:hypothetical protein